MFQRGHMLQGGCGRATRLHRLPTCLHSVKLNKCWVNQQTFALRKVSFAMLLQMVYRASHACCASVDSALQCSPAQRSNTTSQESLNSEVRRVGSLLYQLQNSSSVPFELITLLHDKSGHLVSRQRSTDQVSLDFVTAQPSHHFELLVGFDALAHHAQFQCVRHRYY